MCSTRSSAPSLSISAATVPAQQRRHRGQFPLHYRGQDEPGRLGPDLPDYRQRARSTQVLYAYYTLEADNEDVKAKRLAAETAATFLDEREGAGAHRIAFAFRNDQCREPGHYRPTGSGGFRVGRQTAGDSIEEPAEPHRDRRSGPGVARASYPSIPSAFPNTTTSLRMEELVKQALANRTDLASERESEAATAVNNLGTKNGVLPFAVVGGSESQAGIAGTGQDSDLRWPDRWRPTRTSWVASARPWARCSAATFPPKASSQGMKWRSGTGRRNPTMPSTS